MAITVVVDGRTVRAVTLAGTCIYEHRASRREKLLLGEFRSMVRSYLLAHRRITCVSVIKCMFPGCVWRLRGNHILVRSECRAQRVAARRRFLNLRGQQSIVRYFRPRNAVHFA